MKKLFVTLCVSVILSGIVFIPAFTAHAQGVTKGPVTQGPVQQINDYFSTQAITYIDGTIFDRITINGPPKPPPGYERERATVALPEPSPAMGIKTLTVPAFEWVFGCSSVSGAMIAGYYDRTGFPNMYTGPTNGGLMPLTEDPSWGTWTDSTSSRYPNNPLIASHNGQDGRGTKGSIDDYWASYGSGLDDPYITGAWTQHTWGDGIGDFMKTSQSAYDNTDGSTRFYWYTTSAALLTCSDMESFGIAGDDGAYGRKLFYEARGYTVTDCYAQSTDNRVSGGFSFAQYKAEIDASRPVLLNLQGHSIVGVGYDDSSNTVYLHDTWDNDVHAMPWGDSYAGMDLLGVSIVNLQEPPAGISISPDSYNFGTVTISSPSTQTFTVSSTGMGNLVVGTITVGGAQASQFTVNTDTCSGQTLSPGGACTLNVTFAPSTPGAKSAFLAIPSNDPVHPTVYVALSGTGVATPVPNISVAPTSLDFGSIVIGQTPLTQTVAITNSGTASLDISGIDKTGDDANMFTLAGTSGTNGCGSLTPTILPGTSCNIWVTFTPSAAGPQAAALQFISNDPDPAPQVTMSGTGVILDIDAAPAALAFGNIILDQTSAAQTITITNTGTLALNITYEIIGQSAAMFAVAPGATGGCSFPAETLAPSEVCTLQVTFTPIEYGFQSAYLEISSPDPGIDTIPITLTGTGVYEATPSLLEGTYGTEIAYSGAPSGFGTKKGKIYIGGLKEKVVSWSDGSVTLIFTKFNDLAIDAPYDVSIQPKEPKGSAPIVLPGAFTLKKPEINIDTSDKHGAPEAPAIIKGLWFGTKKGKVYLDSQKCKVTSWTMNPTTGESTITFVVPKTIVSGTYGLEVVNKVGRSVTLFAVP